ncbi:MAG: hypothetical protein V2A66_07460 [Pseudomonadota bacterium]
MPPASFTPVVIVAVCTVFVANTFCGVNVAACVEESYDTAPVTEVPLASARVNVLVVRVVSSAAAENVAVTAPPTGTAVASDAGEVDETEKVEEVLPLEEPPLLPPPPPQEGKRAKLKTRPNRANSASVFSKNLIANLPG